MKASRGLTLIELLVTIAVAAVLLSIAVPSFRTLILNTRRADITNNLSVSMTLARNESLKRGRSARVCAATSAATLGNNTCATGAESNWANGWTVQIADPDPSVQWTVIRVFSAAPDPYTVSGSGTIMFTSAARRMVGGTVKVCDSRGTAEARAVVVGSSGRVRIEDTGVDCTGGG
jgi:type IV fimbrial biogenesis protein FimT